MIAALIAHDERPLEEAVAETMRRIQGAFSAVLLSEGKLIGLRDPNGIRPLVLGRLDDDPVLASETCALDLLGAELEREIEPGELVIVDEEGVRALRVIEDVPAGSLCIFEFIYFARPDSTMRGVELHGARVRMGERLATEAPVEADVVMPIPDSGTPAAIGFARASGIPYSEGLIKNRYVGRTFIQPDQALREHGIKTKFNPLAEVAGKRVVVVDDSIVRGSTTRKIVQMLFESGALEVHVRVSSPPIVSPCFYGIDMASEGELLGAGHSVDEIREILGATSARVPLPRRPPGRDAPAGGDVLPRVPDPPLPDGYPGRPPPGEASLRAGARLDLVDPPGAIPAVPRPALASQRAMSGVRPLTWPLGARLRGKSRPPLRRGYSHAVGAGRLIDCDVHVLVEGSEDFLDFVEPGQRDWFRDQGPTSRSARLHLVAPELVVPRRPRGLAGRLPRRPGRGRRCGRPSSRSAPTIAVLNADDAITVSLMGSSYRAAAFARAHNDWLRERWLERDPQAPRLDPRAGAGSARSGGGDPPLRRRRALHPGAPRRRLRAAVRRPSLPPDLRSGRRVRPRRRDPLGRRGHRHRRSFRRSRSADVLHRVAHARLGRLDHGAPRVARRARGLRATA